jgi:hypothetical protein
MSGKLEFFEGGRYTEFDYLTKKVSLAHLASHTLSVIDSDMHTVYEPTMNLKTVAWSCEIFCNSSHKCTANVWLKSLTGVILNIVPTWALTFIFSAWNILLK